MSLSLLAVVAVAYLLILFIVAWFGDRVPQAIVTKYKPVLLALAGTYTTAWMYFATPAQAVERGWLIPPTFLGAFLMLTLGAPIMVRLVRYAKEQHSGSIADFIAHQYKGSHSVAVGVAIIAIVAIMPYLALQLRAITESFVVLSSSNAPTWMISLAVSLAFAFFAIVFGTKHIDNSAQNNGLLITVALESFIKLVAFAAVAYIAISQLGGLKASFVAALNSESLANTMAADGNSGAYATATLLGMIAMFCLPRQFHILMVESNSEQDIKTVRYIVPLYLGAVTFCLLAVGVGGYLLMPSGMRYAEHFVLNLPVYFGHQDLALLSFIGGISAGSSMMIISSVALATMICHTLITPQLVSRWVTERQTTIGDNMRNIRRVVILLLLIMGFAVDSYIPNTIRLGDFGLVSLSLIAQLAPVVLIPMVYTRVRAEGAIAALVAGSALWYLMMFAPFASADTNDQGRLAVSAVMIDRSVLISLLVNSLVLIIVSELFNRAAIATTVNTTPWRKSQLEQLLAQFVGYDAARATFTKYEQQAIDETTLTVTTQRLLAGIIGESAARSVIEQGHADTESSKLFLHTRELLDNSLNYVGQGISVLNSQQQLVAWNKAYIELFKYPDDLVYLGASIEQLIRYNGEHGLFGNTDIEHEILKRLEHLKTGTAYASTHRSPNGRVIEIEGRPLPDGGFVSTYNDVTEREALIDELQRTKVQLELKVADRTKQLHQTSQELQNADAERIRFIAAAGHDIMQPLNASKLFVGALSASDLSDNQLVLCEQVTTSLTSVQAMIDGLVDLARIDANEVAVDIAVINSSDILSPIVDAVTAQARLKGLDVSAKLSACFVLSDKHLLARMIGNLVSNAIKYTDTGSIEISTRQLQNKLLVSVKDTGIGIDEQVLDTELYKEFYRGPNARQREGLGLGLATVARLAKRLNIGLEVQRHPVGTEFQLSIECAPLHTDDRIGDRPLDDQFEVDGIDVYVVDDHIDTQNALSMLINAWGCNVTTDSYGDGLNSLPCPQLLLIDYHLRRDLNGVDIASKLLKIWGEDCAVVIMSADTTGIAQGHCERAGYRFMRKPINSPQLRKIIAEQRVAV